VKELDQIVKKYALIFGLLGSLIVSGIYLYLWKTPAWENVPVALSVWVVPLVFGIAAQIYCKKKLNGFLSLKQAVLAFFLCVLIIFVLESTLLYLIFVVWDPETQEILRSINEGAVELEKATSNRAVQTVEADYSLKGYALGTTTKLLFYTVIGIITAFFIKKNPETA